MASRTALARRNASLTAMNTSLVSGLLRIYSGAQPATPETTASGTLLATLTLGSTAGDVANGVWTARSITGDTAADATGTAGWFRVLQSGGTTAEFDGAVGTSGAELNLNSVSIVSGGEVNVTALTYTLGM